MQSMSIGVLAAAAAAVSIALLGVAISAAASTTLLWLPAWLAGRLAAVLVAALLLRAGLALLQDTLRKDADLGQLRRDRLQDAFRRLPFTSPASWEAAQIKARWTAAAGTGGSTMATPAAVSPWRQILRIVKRDYIHSWYAHIVPGGAGAFPDRVEDTILVCSAGLARRFDRVDLPLLVSTRVVPLVTKHMQDFRRVEALLHPSLHVRGASAGAGAAGSGPGRPLAVDPSAIVQAHFPALHPALPIHALAAGQTAPALEAYTRAKVEGVLRLLLPEDERAEALVTVARELLTCALLVPMLEWVADPDFWNQMIEEQAGRYLHERQQVSQLRAALETASAQAPPTTASSLPASPAQPSPLGARARRATGAITASTTAQQFDAFLKSISKVKSLAEAKHLRNDIERELRIARAEAAATAGADGPVPLPKALSKEQRVYLERLESAERKIIRRIAALGGGDAKAEHRSAAVPGEAAFATVRLRDILLSPGALGFFMEYMDRRGAAHLVQFWLTVDSFKDPLAGEASSDEDGGEDALPHHARNTAGAWPTASEDIAALWATYLAPGISPRLTVSQRTLDGIAAWSGRSQDSAADPAGPMSLSPREGLEQAERCVFQAQKEVLQTMEDDYFADFRRSELFLKAAVETGQVEARRVSSTLSQHERAPETPGQSVPRGGNSPGAALSAIAAWRPFVKTGSEVTPKRQPGLLTSSPDTNNPGKQMLLHKARSFSFSIPARGRQRSAQSSYDRGSHDASSSPLGPLSPKGSVSHAELALDPMSMSITSEDLQPNGRLPEAAEDLPSAEADRIEALQAALTSIIDGSLQDASQQRRPSSLPSRNSGQELLQAFTSSTPGRPGESRKPSGSGSLGDFSQTSESPSSTAPDPLLRNKTRRVFDDDEDIIETVNSSADEPVDASQVDDAAQIQLAGPGDLCLEGDIRFLQRKILKLNDQDVLLDKMVRAAELTGKQHELKLLVRSQSDLRRDMRTMQFQMEQFQAQQSDNVLIPSLTKATIVRAITSSTVSEKQVVRYSIEMQQLKPSGEVLHCWTVARRYNEFWDLHHELKESIQLSAEMRKKGVDLPSKKLVTFLSDSLIEQRREGLQTYLQRLLSIHAACVHMAVRLFLSKDRAVPLISGRQAEAGADQSGRAGRTGPAAPAPKFVRNIYRSLQTSLDDVLLGPTAFEVLSERLNKQAGDMADELGSSLLGWGSAGMEYGSSLIGGPSFMGQSDMQAILQGNLPSVGGIDTALAGLPGVVFPGSDGDGGSSVFTGPICDLFIELFSLKDSSWIKKQSVVMIIQQLLGATIERKIRDLVKGFASPEAIDGHLSRLKETVWPNDGSRVSSAPRTAHEKSIARARAAKRMQTIVPDVPANIVGRRNARRAMERVHSALQVRILNMHIVLTIIDEFIHALFPELKK